MKGKLEWDRICRRCCPGKPGARLFSRLESDSATKAHGMNAAAEEQNGERAEMIFLLAILH